MLIHSLLLTLVVTSQILSPDSLAVTIYNDGFGIVKDVRNIKFDKGQSTLYFTDVSENIQTQTVTFKAVENSQSVRVYQQNFEKNLINQDAVLKKYIEKNVDVVAQFGNQAKRVSGILLAYSPSVILKTDRGIVIANKIAAIDIASIPDGFFTKPTLNWKVFSEISQTQKCELAYRTSGFQWKADYIITINKQETKSDISGWVTIDNNSGKKYENSKLKLIAGDVNVVKPVPNYTVVRKGDVLEAEDSEAAPSFSQKSFADYHMYTLSKPVTLNESSQKQVEFIPKVFGVSIRKFNQVNINAGGYQQKNIQVTNKIKFNNSREVGLGVPLPKGTFRVFKQDESDKSLEFIGEDSINHTPKDENITLTIGNSFDVKADLIVESRTAYTGGGYKAVMNLTIVNHKDTPVEIEVKYLTSYGSNLSVEWLQSNSVTLQKVSAGEYKFVQMLSPDVKLSYKWTEDYQP